ncbi:glycosyltransferase [Poseidonibacter lekithochrous]|uniref:glycosyltransferase n=1 Tax=Poseidonibacter TaxID=2321187 RepID=UPI001C08B17D|nr:MULTISPECIES: glycosyltransferase [Poseidonibacter]MBU3015758.1 glycosyltransferase [Poseidonibacter lekithochrous]MDO6829058.1 glycosyltransferase [Poseidonibacter sp. 1_MG-2023]
MRKINTIQLVTGLGMGGAEKVVYDLSRYADKSKFNTYVISLSNKTERLEQFLDAKINTTVLNKDNSILNLINMIKELNLFIKENNIHILHAHMSHAMILATLLKLFNPKIKIVTTSHNLNIESKFREFFLFITKFLRYKDIVFSKDILKYFYKNDYEIVPNGIDIKSYKVEVQKNNKFTFLSIGRLETVKNHKILIEAANELKNKFDFEIHIVGDGYLRSDLQNLIDKYKLNNIVKLLGMRRDIPILLNKAHCFLMPSLWEGLPIVLLEAGSSKLPIISTKVGSIPTLLDNDNSYLTDLDNFSFYMNNVFKNYLEASEKAEKLFIKIQKEYSIEKIVKKHEHIYIDTVGDF